MGTSASTLSLSSSSSSSSSSSGGVHLAHVLQRHCPQPQAPAESMSWQTCAHASRDFLMSSQRAVLRELCNALVICFNFVFCFGLLRAAPTNDAGYSLARSRPRQPGAHDTQQEQLLWIADIAAAAAAATATADAAADVCLQLAAKQYRTPRLHQSTAPPSR